MKQCHKDAAEGCILAKRLLTFAIKIGPVFMEKVKSIETTLLLPFPIVALEQRVLLVNTLSNPRWCGLVADVRVRVYRAGGLMQQRERTFGWATRRRILPLHLWRCSYRCEVHQRRRESVASPGLKTHSCLLMGVLNSTGRNSNDSARRHFTPQVSRRAAMSRCVCFEAL